MPKSKKRKGAKKHTPKHKKENSWDGKGGYTKTDGEGNVLFFSKRHVLKHTVPTGDKVEPLKLTDKWGLGIHSETVLKDLINIHPPYVWYWVNQGVSITEEALDYLLLKQAERKDAKDRREERIAAMYKDNS